jgi:hypothetical protein
MVTMRMRFGLAFRPASKRAFPQRNATAVRQATRPTGQKSVSPMRRLSLSAIFLPLIFALVCAAGQAATLVRMHADHIAFYYDRFLIEADGHVRIQTSDGFSVTGDSFSMDLKLNRFLIAGHVTLKTATDTVSGAAVSDFLDFNRLYFVPVTSEPDRWTFLNDDLAHPVKGRIMPGDVFFFPDVTGNPSLTASSATISERTYVHFGGAVANLGGAPVPLGSYVVNFAPNQYFAQNSLSGANFDATINVAGSNNALTAVHIRYDATNFGPYLALEQHLVGKHEYAVFSINPVTKAKKFMNLQLYDLLGTRFQVQTFTQYYSDQSYFGKLKSAAQTTYVTANYAFPHSYVSAVGNLTNYSLLGPGAYSVPSNSPNVGAENHPTQLQFTWTSFNNRIGKLPLYEQTYFGYGFNHDSLGNYYGVPGTKADPAGLQSYGGYTYYTIYNTLIGYTLSTPSLKFGNLDNAYNTYYLNASLNAQRQWYTVPHHVNTATTTVSLSRQFTRPFGMYLAYQIQNTSDIYEHGGYQPFIPSSASNVNCAALPTPPDCDAAYAGFLGASTLHTLNFELNYLPIPDFNISLLARKHTDFPAPFPNGDVFQAPLVNPIGQPINYTYLGQPPYDVTPDVRFRLLPHMLLDIQRTYYFNYDNKKWGSFIIQVLPQ